VIAYIVVQAELTQPPLGLKSGRHDSVNKSADQIYGSKRGAPKLATFRRQRRISK
jgi:hypothetical protein